MLLVPDARVGRTLWFTPWRAPLTMVEVRGKDHTKVYAKCILGHGEDITGHHGVKKKVQHEERHGSYPWRTP